MKSDSIKYRIHFYLLKGVFLLSVLFLFNQCHVARYFYWNVANIDDYQKFANDTVFTKNPQTAFSYSEKPLKLPEKYKAHEDQSLDEFLREHESVSFAFIVNDTIQKESYFNDYTESDYVTSFSVAKSFVATLVGIALHEGHINNLDDPITDYLPYLDEGEFGAITVRHLLNMRSGLEASEGYYNPFGDVAKYYYGTNLTKYLSNIKKKSPPDQNFEYLSVNTQLLADVVEHATSKSIQTYLEEKIWKPLGMQSDALWSIDSEKHSKAKAFCCLSAKMMDFARFGQLYLQRGKWNGEQIVPESWVTQTLSYDSTNIDWQNYPYSFQWRVTSYGAFFAKGIKGQYIYVYPQKGLVALRFGTSYADIDWARFFREMAETNISDKPRIQKI